MTSHKWLEEQSLVAILPKVAIRKASSSLVNDFKAVSGADHTLSRNKNLMDGLRRRGDSGQSGDEGTVNSAPCSDTDSSKVPQQPNSI